MTGDIYDIAEWDRYARAHVSVLTSYQLALFLEAVEYLSGDVVDCGCGSARLAPFLADREDVSSYTGVDCADEMVSVARWVMARLSRSSFSIVRSKIEGLERLFTSAVSIHSYYSWPDPELVLAHIYSLLAPNSMFVLATPNRELDMKGLLRESEKELIAHPYFEEFKRSNLLFAENSKARFVSMGELVDQVQQVGFELVECHQRHYLGGVNFLLLNKP